MIESGLGFIVDKLTNSIEHSFTGVRYETEVALINRKELKLVARKEGWVFNWRNEFKRPACAVYKLTIIHDPNSIQGLVCIEVKTDHVYMHLVESAPFNKGKNKLYSGVPGNLVAFACKLSFQLGHRGTVSFLSKTQLIAHYEKSLGAYHIGGRVMVIETQNALKLMNTYFKNL